MVTGTEGYKLSDVELRKLVHNNRTYLRLKGGFVEMPRTWNRKTVIACLVNMCCGYPKPQTEPQYLEAGKPDPEVFKLREEAKARVLTELESLLQSPVISQWGMALDVTRTDRRGCYLPRPV